MYPVSQEFVAAEMNYRRELARPRPARKTRTSRARRTSALSRRSHWVRAA